MLSTIAALYAVASSWLSPIAYSPDSPDGTSTTYERDRVARRSLANGKDFQGVGSSPRGELSGATSEHSARPPNDQFEELRTSPVDSLRRSGKTVLRDAATSPGEPGLLPPSDMYNGDDTGTDGVRHIGSCMSVVSSDADADGHVSRGVRSPTSNVDTASTAVNARNREKGMKDVATSTADIDHARDCSPSVQRGVEEMKDERECRGLNVDRAMPPACPPSLEKGNGLALPESPYVDVKENIELRKRAERAERELEKTRQRLQRTLEGGAAGQASVDTAFNRAEKCNGGVGHEDETESTPSLQRGRNYSRRRRSAHRSVPAAMGTKARISSRNAKNNRSRDVPEDSSSSDSIEGQRRYSSDDNREGSLGRQAQSVQDYKSTKHDKKKSRRSRRRHSIAPESRSTGGGAKVDARENLVKGKEDVDSHRRERKERRGRVELRASDLRRMREVIARLKITTALLHAERAKRAHAHVGDEEGNSDALAQENAILRRKLYGLMKLEELEGRAMEKNLLPLTGGELSGGDFFPREALK